ncbi:patatin-like phospholipase family protein [Erwinia sp. Eh17-17]|uniref:patatin-like phospholipase family protein n=1 Tax=Erwinia sp. Eh17-17 TaxID=3080330 RepID=UPI0032082919
MSKLECYAVFEGGGVKGSAFAGALVSAENAEINFVGYGGASVGSIIAFLSCLGFTSSELELRIKSLDLSEFLDQGIVNETNIIHEVISQNKKIINDSVGSGIRGSITSKLKVIKNSFRLDVITSCLKIIGKLKSRYGVHSKDEMIKILIKYAKEKISTEYLIKKDGVETISFKDFFHITGKDLRLVATNLNSRRAERFSHIDTPNHCVFKAVAASSSFPFFYEPTIEGESYLIDGGVSCNLPSFLFANEVHKRLPIYAFDLVVDSAPKKKFNNIITYTWNIITSLLDASTEIISEEVGCIVVPVKIPIGINTLDFNLNSEQINSLFESGKESAKNFFENHDLTELSKEANDSHKVGALIYGVYDEILADLADRISFQNLTVNTWLYTCINSEPKEIISFSVGSNSDFDPPHYQYSLSQQGIDCVEAWKNKSIEFKFDNNKVRVCFPISKKNIKEGDIHQTKYNPILGVLCLSVACNKSICNWLNYNAQNGQFDIDQDFVIIVNTYVNLIGMAMLGNQLVFHDANGYKI